MNIIRPQNLGVSFKKAEVVLSVSGTTVTFDKDIRGNDVAIGDFMKCKVLLGGSVQPYSYFTKTSSKVIESTQGSIVAGTIVSIEIFD